MMKIENFQCTKKSKISGVPKKQCFFEDLCMKKAQTEIMGLVIVVILIIIGMSFATRFMAGPADYKKQFTQAELASNTLNALLRTTTACKISMTELLQNCGQSKDIICNEKNPCDYVEQETKKIFEKTLEKWNVDYEFKVLQDENPIFILGETCIGDKKSRMFPIPTASGDLFVRLDICS